MEKFSAHEGLVAPLDRANVDTDQIIPKQFLRSIKRTGFGPNLFDEWRYLDSGQIGMDNSRRPLNEDFVLNDPKYAEASILLARENFGCGSSREHAVWALMDYGFKVVVSSGFADIFAGNAVKNGLLLAQVSEQTLDKLFTSGSSGSALKMAVDLEGKTLRWETRETKFDIDDTSRDRLLKGLDDISITLAYKEEIKAYQARRQKQEPWLFPKRT